MTDRADVARSVVVHGRVQGVFFRDGCQREADSAQVRGWVRNADDGTVQAHLEGDPDAVQRMLDWMAEGPNRAEVERIDVREAEARGHDGFEVR